MDSLTSEERGVQSDESGREQHPRPGEPEEAPSDPFSALPPEVAAAPRSEGPLAWRLGGALRTIRPHQWVKNVFVLAPVAFAKEIFDLVLLTHAAAAFLVFSLLAGAVYTINDLLDVESDRQHPVKRHRPIASGRVPMAAGKVLAVALVVVALVGAVGLGWSVQREVHESTALWGLPLVATSYFVINLAYSFRLKHVAYLDVGCISAGFVLRVLAGGFATGVPLSRYLVACTALLALFLGFGKRRHELTAARRNAKRQRAALEDYTQRGLDLALWLTALTTVGTYLAYTLDPQTRALLESDWLWVSTVFVVAGVLRFVHLVRTRPHAESPTQEMLKDGPMMTIVLSWVGLVMWVVYNLRPA